MLWKVPSDTSEESDSAMKTAALKKFRHRLQQQEPVVGLWVTLESASLTEMAVALGVDWVVVDAEHGHLDWKDINEHIRAALRSETVVLVRLAERSTALTKRALDIGADGVVIPWIETADQLREADRKSTRLNSSHIPLSRMPSSA